MRLSTPPSPMPATTVPYERVLIVEDDAVTSMIVAAAITGGASAPDARAHFEPHCVTSLAAALEALRQGTYAAVLLDLSLPDSSGMETLHTLLDADANCAIIVLTALDDSDIALEAVRLGAQDFLFKGRVDATLIIRSLLYAISRHRSEVQLRHARQMEALGRMAGGVAHDFNNLLTVVIGNAEAIESQLIPPDEIHEAVGEIRQAARRAAALTQRLLSLGRQQQLHPQLLDAGQMVRDLEPVLRRLVGADMTFSVGTQGAALEVTVDPSQLEQLVINLVLNARDAVPPGGRITVDVALLDVRDPDAWLPRLPHGEYVSLAVRDNGAGIAPDVQAQMYDPFVTTKGPGKGTGLGLSIVFGIVQQSHGAIRCESTLGVGTTFTVAFPRTISASDHSSHGGDASVRESGGDVILLVEDEPAIRSLARRILEHDGYVVLEAANGDEALARFDAEGDRVSLVLTDVVMPGLRGTELVAALARRRPDLPVLFMSGYADDDLLRRGVMAGHVAMLKKPFTSADLLATVRKHLHRASGADCAIA